MWRVALVLLVLLLDGCRAQPPTDGVIRFGLSQPPHNLDPRYASDAASERICRLLYRQLVDFDDQGLPRPDLATWDVLDARHYRFHLRGGPGRVFSDGEALTSADVAATYRSVLASGSASPQRGLLSVIAGIETPDSDTIDFHLREADPLFPAYLGLGILPAHALAQGQSLAARPLGSGPLRLLQWTDPNRLLLERRADGQRIELVAVKDPGVRVMQLMRGEVQVLQNDLSPELVDFLGGRPGIRLETRPGSNFSYFGFNLEDVRTGQLAVRQALAHAIDRRELIHYLLHDRARLAEGLFPPEHWLGRGDLQPYEYDPQRARALLQSAGFGPDRPLHLTLKTSTDPLRVRIATAIRMQVARVGIDLEVRSYDWGTFFGDIKAGRFQISALTWVGVRTPDIFRYVYHSASVPPEGANRGRYHNPEVDRWIERARKEPDLARQARDYAAVQAQVHTDLPYLPLWFEAQVLAIRDGLSGYRLAADGNYDALACIHWNSENAPHSCVH